VEQRKSNFRQSHGKQYKANLADHEAVMDILKKLYGKEVTDDCKTSRCESERDSKSL